MTSIGKRPMETVKKEEEKKQKVTQPQRHHGLYNQGATSYLNSVLQVLFVTTEIHDKLDESHIIDRELKNAFEKLKKKTCETENVTRSLEISNVNQQSDAAECLEMILHKFSPKASEVFQGELLNIIKCSENHSISEARDPFWTLLLSLKDTQDGPCSVRKGLERIFEKKSFSGDNKVYCNECKQRTEATIESEMVKSPKILILLLKRFDFDYNTMSPVKSPCCVDVPFELQTKNKVYKLYGMVNHMSSLRGGHYTATVLSNEDKTWYECNDHYITKVQEQLFAENGIHNSNTVHLLAYRDSGSLRDQVREERDELREQREQRGHNLENKRKRGQGDAGNEENKKNQEDEELMSHGGRGEKSDANDEKVSSSNEDKINESLLNPTQNTSHSGEQRIHYRMKAQRNIQRGQPVGNEKKDEKFPQTSTNIWKKLLWILLGFMIFTYYVIIPVVRCTLN